MSAENHNGLAEELHKLGDLERRVVAHILHRKSVARDPNKAFDETMTFGARVADRVAAFGGSWKFIGIFLSVMIVWMAFNALSPRPWDVYPFILLNLLL